MPSGSTLITALEPVRPGDLIEADLFNKLIGAVRELDDRVSKLQAECRKTAPDRDDTEVRPIIIETAVVKVGTALSFKVTGRGLDPSDLEDRFHVGDVSFRPEKLRGTDEAITFAADLAQFGVDSTTAMRGMNIRAATPEASLTISAKRGVSATHELEVVR
jgi:hypothetical protein